MLNPEVTNALLNPGNTNIKPGLERMHAGLEKLSNPQNNYKVIHITGSNGKGSTATFITTGLIHTGYKVGKFMSPHVSKINECISINHQEISDEAIEKIYFIVEKINQEYKINPSPFELLTLIMFYYMADEKVDYLVLEAGMGGATDCTNVVDSIYSVITNVSLEHTKWLGNTLEEIATNKAGIIKNGKTIIADNGCELLNAVKSKTTNYVNVLEKYCLKVELDDKNFKTIVDISLPDNGFTIESGMTNIASAMLFPRQLLQSTKIFTLALYGEFQAYNFLIAYEVLNDIGVGEDNIRYAAENTFIPYRMQIVSQEPLIIFDIAHNLAGAGALLTTLSERYNKDNTILITAILVDKDIERMLEVFSKIASTIIFTTIKDNPRAISANNLSKYSSHGLFKQRHIIAEPREALKFAKLLGKNIIVSGSSYLFRDMDAASFLVTPPSFYR